MKPSVYDWPLIIHKVKVATDLTDIDIAAELDHDVSTVRYWRRGGCPRFDDGEWFREQYEKAYGEPMPKKRQALSLVTAPAHKPKLDRGRYTCGCLLFASV